MRLLLFAAHPHSHLLHPITRPLTFTRVDCGFRQIWLSHFWKFAYVFFILNNTKKICYIKNAVLFDVEKVIFIFLGFFPTFYIN